MSEPSPEAAFRAVAQEILRTGGEGEAVIVGNAGPGSTGYGFRGPMARARSSGNFDAKPEDRFKMACLAAVLDAFPGVEECMFEVQLHADRRWEAVACWAPDWAMFGPLARMLRECPQAPMPLSEPTPVPEERLQAFWEERKSRHRSRPPADAAELEATELALGRPLPRCLRALYALADGGALDHDQADDDDDGPLGMLGPFYWHSLAELRKQWAWDGAFARDPRNPHPTPIELRPGVIAPVVHHPGWLPIGIDGGGNPVAIDLAPGPEGRLGQIILYGPDLNDGAELLAWSLEDLMDNRGVGPAPPRVPRLWYIDDDAVDQPLDPGWLDREEDAEVAGEMTIRIDGPVDTRLLSRCRKLRQLYLTAESADLTGLAELPLQDLQIRSAQRLDLSPLAGHPTLEVLTIKGNRLPPEADSLASLLTMPRLRRLDLPHPLWSRIALAMKDHPTLELMTFGSEDWHPLSGWLEVAAIHDRPGRVLKNFCFRCEGQL